MTTIQGKKFLTVYAKADEVYTIDYGTTPTVNILNTTEGDVLIGVQKDFPDNLDETAGHFLTLPAGNAANGVTFPTYKVYIKAAEAGNIVIERCI